jgi:hypothetical protein
MPRTFGTKPNQRPTSAIRRFTGRCRCAPVGASRMSRWNEASPSRCPSHAASTPPAADPITSPIAMIGPRCRRTIIQAAAPSRTPAPAPSSMNHPSSAKYPSGSLSTGYTPPDSLISSTRGASSHQSRPSGPPTAAATPAMTNAAMISPRGGASERHRRARRGCRCREAGREVAGSPGSAGSARPVGSVSAVGSAGSISAVGSVVGACADEIGRSGPTEGVLTRLILAGSPQNGRPRGVPRSPATAYAD